MYGAIVCPQTELVSSGIADVGVLFIHNEGFSTMCGHATIALGRFLVDTQDADVFPNRNKLTFNSTTREIYLNLHAPCGVVRVTVPTTADGRKSDPSRSVTFISTPAFASALQLTVPIPPEIRWPELGVPESITLDIGYGGAFYALVPIAELGFSQGLGGNVDLDATTRCAKKLQPYLATLPEIIAAIQHPEDERLSFLYSLIMVDTTTSGATPHDGDIAGAETGLCYFADSQIDRSPTGSGVTARVAVAHAKGLRSVGQRWAYNSLVSNHFGEGMFTTELMEEVAIDRIQGGKIKGVTVKVEGKAFYTGTSAFVVENEDVIADGFTMEGVAS